MELTQLASIYHYIKQTKQNKAKQNPNLNLNVQSFQWGKISEGNPCTSEFIP